MTVTVQIGNSDDKLKQADWACFIIDVDILIEKYAARRYFTGRSDSDEMWQNAAWVIETSGNAMWRLRDCLSALKSKYQQDSIAWTEGETTFL